MITDKMIEAAARAANLEAGRQRGLTDKDDWHEITEQERGGWRLVARAALEAVATGTEVIFMRDQEIFSFVVGRNSYNSMAGDAVRDIIRRAINESKASSLDDIELVMRVHKFGEERFVSPLEGHVLPPIGSDMRWD